MEYNSKSGISDYSFKVNTDTLNWKLPSQTSSQTYTNSTSCTSTNCGCSGWHYYYPNYGWYWYPQAPVTKYLYQIFCPKPGCNGKFWSELDEIKPCPKCKSKIKITDKESDYEVNITK